MATESEQFEFDEFSDDTEWDDGFDASLEEATTTHCPYCGAPLRDRYAYSDHLIQGCGAPQK